MWNCHIYMYISSFLPPTKLSHIYVYILFLTSYQIVMYIYVCILFLTSYQIVTYICILFLTSYQIFTYICILFLTYYPTVNSDIYYVMYSLLCFNHRCQSHRRLLQLNFFGCHSNFYAHSSFFKVYEYNFLFIFIFITWTYLKKVLCR